MSNQDQKRQAYGRNQFQNDERWIREQERGEIEDIGDRADDEGGAMSE
jgi:hypothetical protein